MKESYKDSIPFVYILVPFIAGIAISLNLSPQVNAAWLNVTLFVFIALFIAVNSLYNRLKIYKLWWTGSIIASVILFIAGVTVTQNNTEINKPAHFSNKTARYLVAQVITEPVIKNATIHFNTEVIQCVGKRKVFSTSGKLLVSLSDQSNIPVKYGDILIIPARYQRVAPPLNPAEFNYKRYLAGKNIYHQTYLYTHEYRVIKKQAGNKLITYALNLRQQLVNKFKVNITNPDASAIASTLILGYNAELSNDILQAYSKTGTIHVLSVSGAHVGLIYIVLLLLLSPFSPNRYSKVPVTLCIIFFIWVYALLTGFSPPVCRAAVMLSFILTGKCFARRISTLNILALSAFIMLMVQPFLLIDVGFQLSYLAVAGLIILQPLIYGRLKFKNEIVNKLWVLCSASIAAQAATLPLSILYFHQVPIYFLISNLLILIPSALIMYGGIVYLIIPQHWVISKWLGFVVEKLILFTNKLLAVIEAAPLASIDRVWLHFAEVILFYLIIITLSLWLYKRKRMFMAAATALAVVVGCIWYIKQYELLHNREMLCFSLRKNTCIVIRDGNKAVVITDLVENSKTFNYSVKPYLDSCRVDSVKICDLTADVNTSFISKSIILFNALISVCSLLMIPICL